MRVFLISFWLVLACSLGGVEIALTFDDFPMGKSLFLAKKERAQLFAEKLSELHIQAAFFCIGRQIAVEEDVECVKIVDAEHLLANHSFNHRHLSEMTLEEFEEELMKTEEVLVGFNNFRRWFRFPYLDYGDRKGSGGSDRKRCAAFLALRKAGYQHGYATINTFDWYVDGQLKKAAKEGKEIHWERLKEAYLSLLDEWMEIYNERWSKILHNNFVHVLLLHANDLNALFLEEIVQLIDSKEWEIVSPDKAFDSPIPYLSNFTNTQKGLFKGVSAVSTGHIDEVLAHYQVFE